MTLGSDIVMLTTRMPSVLGIKRLAMIHPDDAPSVSDATTNSRVFSYKTRPLVLLAAPIQPVILIAITSVAIFPLPITTIKRIM